MCGVVGCLLSANRNEEPIGRIVLDMLEALYHRGPESAGVALYDSVWDGEYILRIKIGECFLDNNNRKIFDAIGKFGEVLHSSTIGEYLRVGIGLRDCDDAAALERSIESAAEGMELVSMGRALEIVKQVGSPRALERRYAVSHFSGTHAIGHVRLATESRVDLSHSQPFWAHGFPDLAIAHNGHISNYRRLRRIYEQEGIKFYTENDSEIVAAYLARQMTRGLTFEQALTASIADLDGSFSYIAATRNALGFAKDPFAFKPLFFADTGSFVAIATEEMALRSAFKGAFEVREAQAREVQVWELSAATIKPAARSI